MEEDLALIAKFKEGNMEGFEMLVKKYHNRIINIAHSLAANRNDAEDIAQEVFLKIYHTLHGFKAQAKFSSWLYRITVNAAYDYLRKNKHKTTSLDDIDYANISDNRNREDMLAKEAIQGALNKIPFDFRTTLVLKEIEGLSYQEIAEALKISIGTVESRIFRARQMLKKLLIQKETGKQ